MAQEVKFQFNPDQAEDNQEPVTQPEPENKSGYAHSEPSTPEPAEPQEPEKGNEPEPQEPAPQPEPEEGKDKTKPTPEPEPEKDIDDNKLLEQLRKKGFKGNSLEELLKDKESKPAPKTYDEETQKFLEYQERTGRGLKDYQQLNKDYSKMSPVEVAKDRIKRESGDADLTPQDLNYLLEEELGFDPADKDLSDQEKAKFKRFYGSHLSTLKSEQQKYNDPIEGYQGPEEKTDSKPDGGKKIQLSNGTEVDEESYLKERKKYLETRDAALQDLKPDTFKLTYDGKDGKKELDFDLEYTDEDLHSMKSITEDVGSILSNYQNEESGEFKHADFNRDALWMKKDFREKAIGKLLSKARNEVIAEFTRNRKNVNFNSPNDFPEPSGKKGYTEPGQIAPASGPSVKYPFPG